MRKKSVVFELTDGEIRAFWFTVPFIKKQGHVSNAVKFDQIPIPTGIIEQGNVRNEKALIGILSTYRAQYPGNNHRTYLAIPLKQGFIRVYMLPWLAKKDIKSAISLLVAEETPIAGVDLLYDYLVISKEKDKSLQILLGATRRSLLDSYVFIFGQAGFKVIGVDFALFVLGQALGFEPNEDVLYLEGESDCCKMVLFRGAVPDNVRTLLLQQLPHPFLSEDNQDHADKRVKEWGNEIRRFLLYYRTQQPDLDLKRLVWNGDIVVDQLASGLLYSDHVSSVEQAKIKFLPDIWKMALEENKGKGEVAVGYGIRITARRRGLNLWRQPYLAQIAQLRYRKMAIIIFALFITGIITWFPLYQRELTLKQEVLRLSHQGSKIEAQNKYQEDLEVAWKRVKMNPKRIGEGLEHIRTLPGAELKFEQVIFKQGTISLRGNSHDPESVQTLIRTLRVLGWEHPVLSEYKLTSSNNVEFFLSAKSGYLRTETITTNQVTE
ncbi:MAG: competence protein ComA [Desulfosporosinus sp. BRH_c37]|nr:MAG: competence protein ComA [Desulfosporosinus sp. BRH_c37]